MYKMDGTYQKAYTHLTKELFMLFLLSWVWLVLVLILSKYEYVLFSYKKRCKCLRFRKCMNLLMLLFKRKYVGGALYLNVLIFNRKKWLFELFYLFTVKSLFLFSTYELVVDVVCMNVSSKIQKVVVYVMSMVAWSETKVLFST